MPISSPSADPEADDSSDATTPCRARAVQRLPADPNIADCTTNTSGSVIKEQLTVKASSNSFALGLLLATSACSTIAPYERERLAKPDMAQARNADAKSGAEHATAYREGTGGAVGSSGGGCGCN